MVLFVFVIMLLNAGEEERTHGAGRHIWSGFPACCSVRGAAATLFYAALGFGEADWARMAHYHGDLSRVLFRESSAAV